MKRVFLPLLVGLLSVAGSPSAFAQYYRPPYPAYNPYGANYGYGSANPGRGYNQGAALQGQAAVQSSYGQTVKSLEDARVTREKANQAKLDTKKQAFDLMNYEKANTPTYLEDLTRDQANLLTRIMTAPLKAEIADGRTLNVMMPQLQSMASKGAQGPPVTLSSAAVNALNIAGATGGSIGMLKDGGEIDWLPVMRGPQQKKLDKLLPAACKACVDRTLDNKLMKQIRTEMTSMRETLRKQMQTDEIDTNAYIQAVEVYNSLERSIKALERPDARKQFSGAMKPKARNVPELVEFMTDNGFSFAPATPGFENQYKVVHDAFVRYARTAQSSSGLHALNAPDVQSKYKKFKN